MSTKSRQRCPQAHEVAGRRRRGNRSVAKVVNDLSRETASLRRETISTAKVVLPQLPLEAIQSVHAAAASAAIVLNCFLDNRHVGTEHAMLFYDLRILHRFDYHIPLQPATRALMSISSELHR